MNNGSVIKDQSLQHDLASYLDITAAKQPDAHAVINPDGSIVTYGELSHKADNIANYLHGRGVTVGDCVGLYMRKHSQVIAAIFGILRLGAAYVPTDVSSSVTRAIYVLNSCDARIVLIEQELLPVLVEAAPHLLDRIVIIESLNEERETNLFSRKISNADQLAYILYTSGSTGVPKGVAINQLNAVSFIEWAAETFNVKPDDQVSSHAPLHFDLSIFDIFVSIKCGACIHLIDIDLAANPRHLIRFIALRKITIWYSAPSILAMIAELAKSNLAEKNQLRLVLFAGEVFPIARLKVLLRMWPDPDYYNLYGPTETNVCTFCKVSSLILEDRNKPLSIGWPCSHCETIIVNENNQPVELGGSGLLCVSGPSVIEGYWNSAEQMVKRIFEFEGKRWYNTGDVVRTSSEGYVFLGRRDRMVKRYGYRIELDEIEACLASHPNVIACALVRVGTDSNLQIIAFLVTNDVQPTASELGRFCNERLAKYMIPDSFRFLETLPSTSTGKTNYQILEQQCQLEPMSV